LFWSVMNSWFFCLW